MYKFVEGNPDQNFWDQNPQLKYFNQTKMLLEDVGYEVSSKIMWAIYLTEDPDSKFYSMDRDERRKVIASNYLDNPDFDWGLYEYIIEEYPNMAMSLTKKWYKQLTDKFDDSMNKIRALDILEDRDFAQFIAMYSKLEVMVKGLDKMESKYQAERSKNVETRGQQQSGFFGKVKE